MPRHLSVQRLKSSIYWLVALCWVGASGCAFDSSLNEVSCEVEGSVSQNRLC